MYSHNRDSMRRYFLEAWRKSREGAPLAPLEYRIAEVIHQHPEYHVLLQSPDIALGQDYLPEEGQTNPFLHMSLHLAILEQMETDRPAGVRKIYLGLVESAGGTHEATHRMMDCLAEGLWQAQRAGLPPDERSYLTCLQRLAGRDLG